MVNSYELLREEYSHQKAVLQAADRIVLYGNSIIACILKTAVRDLGFTSECSVFDNGAFLEDTASLDRSERRTAVIACSARIRTRESMRRDAEVYFSGAEVFDFYALYFQWIAEVVRRDCDLSVLADTLRLCREERAIPNIDSINTLFCTLNCKECSNGIQYRTDRRRIDAASQMRHLKKLTDILPIAQCNFQGGEVFTDADFAAFVEAHAHDPRLAFLTVATNGTILPPDRVFSAMKNCGCMVRISDYGSLSVKKDALIERCAEFGIPCFTFPMAETWRKFGPYEKRGRTREELTAIRDQCCFGTHDLMFLDDRLYCCLRTLYGSAVGDTGEDVAANTLDLDAEVTEEKLLAFIRGDALWRMCDHCDHPMAAIRPAEQMGPQRGRT